MNLMMLCHGAPDEENMYTVELKKNQTLQYRGKFGTGMSPDLAKYVVKALRENATVSEVQLASGLKGYQATDPLDGPKSFRPDFYLQGDDKLLCFIMNMNTGRWMPLGPDFNTTLGKFIAGLGTTPFWLNLLCCSFLPDSKQTEAFVNPQLKAGDWNTILSAPMLHESHA
jgi:hypothetical protein